MLVEVHEANVVDVDGTVSIGCFRFRMQDNSKEYNITCFCIVNYFASKNLHILYFDMCTWKKY